MSVQTPEAAEMAPEKDFGRVIFDLARDISRLDSGDAARLRRDPFEGAGAPAFWRLWYEHQLAARGGNDAAWSLVMQGMAIMTPKGKEEGKPSAHDGKAKLGAALFESGYSELRLLRLAEAPLPRRCDALIRICRFLARGQKQADWRHLAALLLDFKPEDGLRRLVKDYYDAQHKAGKKDAGASETHA
jgi:CRISPR type I-E-associated protein CasB/Cse2